jgi:hypothetical protein
MKCLNSSKSILFLSAALLFFVALIAAPSTAFAQIGETPISVYNYAAINDAENFPGPVLRSKSSTVVNTYRTFDGIAGGTPLANYRYAVTYKQLAFRNSYSQTADTWVSSYNIIAGKKHDGTRDLDIGRYGAGTGTVNIWRCNYRIY